MTFMVKIDSDGMGSKVVADSDIAVEELEALGYQPVAKSEFDRVPTRPAPEPQPTELDRLRADVDYIAAMGGIEL